MDHSTLLSSRGVINFEKNNLSCYSMSIQTH